MVKFMGGFTLIETIISILIIGIAFTGLLAVFTAVFKDALYDEAVAVSCMLARGEMEKAIAQGFSITSSSGNYTGPFSNYSWEVVVGAVPQEIADDPDMNNYKEITVYVTNQIAGRVYLKTIIANY